MCLKSNSPVMTQLWIPGEGCPEDMPNLFSHSVVVRYVSVSYVILSCTYILLLSTVLFDTVQCSVICVRTYSSQQEMCIYTYVYIYIYIYIFVHLFIYLRRERERERERARRKEKERERERDAFGLRQGG